MPLRQARGLDHQDMRTCDTSLLVCTVGRPKGAVERYLCLELLTLSLPPVSSTSMLATVNAEELDHCLLHCVKMLTVL
jgi:hypothetical protein